MNDERLRKIIEKHVLRPLFNQSHFQGVQTQVEESLRISKSFLTTYVTSYMQSQ